MLCSKLSGDPLISDQVDDCAQRSKDQDEEESPESDQVTICNGWIKKKKKTHS
jgi:hypothetical protein